MEKSKNYLHLHKGDWILLQHPVYEPITAAFAWDCRQKGAFEPSQNLHRAPLSANDPSLSANDPSLSANAPSHAKKRSPFFRKRSPFAEKRSPLFPPCEGMVKALMLHPRAVRARNRLYIGSYKML